MSINIGTPAVDACKRLQGSEDFRTLRDAIHEQVRARMNTALECPSEGRVDATAYARALRDVYLALEAATSGKPYAQVAKPTVIEKGSNVAR